MIEVIYVGLTCDDVYKLVVARFEISEYATADLSVVCLKSLTSEEIDNISAFSNC